MEMDLADGRAVDFGLGFADAGENPFGQVLLRRGQHAAGVDLLGNVMQMTVGMLGLMLDFDFRRAKSVAFDLFARQANVGEAERVDACLNGRQLDTAIDESSERHVTADTAETINVGYLHRRRGSFFCWTTVTLFVIPPRCVNAATSFIRRGCSTATRSSRMRLVTFS